MFVFDFNTEYKYREILGEQTIAEDREECSFIWDNYYDEDERINEYELTLFVQDEEQPELYRKYQEDTFSESLYAGADQDICLLRQGLNM